MLLLHFIRGPPCLSSVPTHNQSRCAVVDQAAKGGGARNTVVPRTFVGSNPTCGFRFFLTNNKPCYLMVCMKRRPHPVLITPDGAILLTRDCSQDSQVSFIVGQSPSKGKAHNDMLLLQSPREEIRQV